MEKTANAVVFPRLEPYLTVSRIYEAAEKMAAAEIAQHTFDKEGDGFFSSLASNTLANLAPGGPTLVPNVKKKPESIEDELSPEYYNRMKSQDVKRTFTLLTLYDDELKQYELPELVRAYNDAVQINPDAYKSPPILRNLMIKNLQSVGVKDPYEIKTELEVAQLMREPLMKREEDIKQDKVRKALLDADDPVVRGAPLIGGGQGGENWKAVKEVLDNRVQDYQEYKKDRKENSFANRVKERGDEMLSYADASKVPAAGGPPAIREAAEDFERNGLDGISRPSRKVLRMIGYIKP